MKPDLPEEINETLDNLEEFEKSLKQSQTVKLNLFPESMRELDNYLRNNPHSPHAQYIVNKRIAHIRSVIKHLKSLDINFADDVSLAVFFIKVLVPIQNHIEPILEADPSLRKEYEDFFEKWRRSP
jgi:hypothetical protein